MCHRWKRETETIKKEKGCQRHEQRRAHALLIVKSGIHPASTDDLTAGPLHGKHRRLQELLVRILLVQVVPMEVCFREFLHKILVSLDELLLGVARVIDEIRVLKKESEEGKKSVTCINNSTAIRRQCGVHHDNGEIKDVWTYPVTA